MSEQAFFAGDQRVEINKVLQETKKPIVLELQTNQITSEQQKADLKRFEMFFGGKDGQVTFLHVNLTDPRNAKFAEDRGYSKPITYCGVDYIDTDANVLYKTRAVRPSSEEYINLENISIGLARLLATKGLPLTADKEKQMKIQVLDKLLSSEYAIKLLLEQGKERMKKFDFLPKEDK